MKVDVLLTDGFGGEGPTGAEAERLGFDGGLTFEARHDPFVGLALAARETTRLELGTAIAVAFARNPMTLAMAANDIQLLSEGRLVLGLGSQVKAHIERRFSMPWSKPVERMREMIVAMRTIWSAWQDGTKLDFQGDFYSHTLLPPFFDPGRNPHGPPCVLLAAVGPRMTEVAGEVADGVMTHAFTTPRYLETVTLPALRRGAARAGKDPAAVLVSSPCFIVTGRTEEELAAADVAVRRQVAFYGSTPAYRDVLALHGWGDAQTELTRLSKEGKWAAMGEVIDDGMLQEFAVVGAPDELPALLQKRLGDIADRVTLYTPYNVDPTLFSSVLAAG